MDTSLSSAVLSMAPPPPAAMVARHQFHPLHGLLLSVAAPVCGPDVVGAIAASEDAVAGVCRAPHALTVFRQGAAALHPAFELALSSQQLEFDANPTPPAPRLPASPPAPAPPAPSARVAS